MELKKEESSRLDALYKDHHQSVYRTCLRFAAGDQAWAMDRAQDVFIKLAQELPKLKDLDDLGGWLYRVAANICLMELRREKGWRKVTHLLSQVALGTMPSPEAQVRARRDVSEVELAIRDLPANERALMVLVYLDGKSQTEAAELLGFSKGHVSKLHKRAMAALDQRDWEVQDA